MKIAPEQYKAALMVVIDYRNQLRSELDQLVTEIRKAEGKNAPQKHSTLRELLPNKQCSVRRHNVILHNREALGISTLPRIEANVKIGDLEGVSVLKLLSCRNAGVATAREFKELCAIRGVRWSPWTKRPAGLILPNKWRIF